MTETKELFVKSNKNKINTNDKNKHDLNNNIIEKTVDQVFSNIGKKRKIDEIKVKSEIKN